MGTHDTRALFSLVSIQIHMSRGTFLSGSFRRTENLSNLQKAKALLGVSPCYLPHSIYFLVRRLRLGHRRGHFHLQRDQKDFRHVEVD